MPRRKKVKIWHIGDTHTYHRLLKVPRGIDLVIFSGDCSNPRDRYKNEPEVRDFMLWFANLKIKYKIFVAGNHDTSIFHKLFTRNDFIALNITYLENEYAYVEDLKIFGCPYTPTFGDWVFNKARHSMNEIWKEVDADTDIIVTHGPPKGFLDATVDFNGYIKQAGDVSLRRHVLERIKPKLVCFGHLHNDDDIINAGVLKLSAYDTIFSNGSVVTDGKFGRLSSNGNILAV